jgi:hypothetical protein
MGSNGETLSPSSPKPMQTMNIPSLLIAGLISIVPLALQAQAPTQATVTVRGAGGAPVLNAKVSLILKSGAYQNATLVGEVYACEVPGPCAKVYAAAPGHEASVTKVGAAGPGAITVTLTPSATKSSQIIEREGKLPEIEGYVAPVHDQQKRMYIYTKKIGLIENGRPAAQPLKFTLKQSIDAETATGKKFNIWVVDITQQVSLLEYTMPQ